jgi:hypothetical protein
MILAVVGWVILTIVLVLLPLTPALFALVLSMALLLTPFVVALPIGAFVAWRESRRTLLVRSSQKK